MRDFSIKNRLHFLPGGIKHNHKKIGDNRLVGSDQTKLEFLIAKKNPGKLH